MIAAWMVYAVAVSLIFGLAGMALEQSLRFARRPARLGVAAALLGSIVVPVVTREGPAAAEETLVPAVLTGPIVVSTQGLPTFPTFTGLDALDLALIGLWIVAASLGLGLVIGTQLRVLREARECSESVVHGVPVRRTRSFGPATVGCVRSVIVLPAWTDLLDAESQRLTVLHEQQHLRARDPQLLFAALILTALQPWNVALWWQLVRLRNAIEVDCDQRMLAAGVDVRSYGSLLLRIAASRALTRVAALALSNAKTFVVRRVRTMADHRAKSRYVKSTFAALVAAALVVLGCETPSPVQVEGPTEPVAVEEPDAELDFRYQSRHNLRVNPVVEYEVTAQGIEEVLQYLRDAGVSRALREGIDVKLSLDPVIVQLHERGVLQEVAPSQEPLNVLFEDRDGAPQGLIRVWEDQGERRIQLFKAVSVKEGN